jgi:16S rRNA (cytosine967-C5)-methyltransferase
LPLPRRSAPLDQALLGAALAIEQVRAGRSLDVALARRPPADAALAAAVQDIAYAALRRYGRGDFVLARLIPRPLDEPLVYALLLAALARLEARADPHTVVDRAVAAAARIGAGRFKPLVNAVLRAALRRRAQLEAAAQQDEPARWQHPLWWIARLRRAYPRDWETILAAGNARAPMTLRANRRLSTAQDSLAELHAAGIAAHCAGGEAIRLERPLPVAALPGFAAGRLSVQDAGAQRAAGLLDLRDGLRVLDACAAPGGKCAHMLETAALDLLALDCDSLRLARVGENLERLGLAATLRTADCRATETWWDGRPFDRILLDAPCSASGVVRRHPDIKWLRREADLAGFAREQARLLDALWRLLAPDGKLLYVTCSVFAEENEAAVAAFLARRSGARRLALPGLGDGQLLPDDEHDGFFYAALANH